jgi:hypothetical protein
VGEKAALDYEVIARMGYNQKQNRVELQSGEVKSISPAN